MPPKPTEELLAAPLPDLIRNLGLAVAEANLELSKVKGADILYTIPEAEIEVNIAITISDEKKTGISAGGTLYGFSVNASYARTYGFKEEASSRLKIKLAAKPRDKPAS